MYYSRETEGQRDLLLHTLVKTFQNFRKDLRLYMSTDQGRTWQEAFQLQPGYAAYSSMQRLANGDLAIIFEDGSLGNQDKQDCYAMNYVVLSRETVEARAAELFGEFVPDAVRDLHAAQPVRAAYTLAGQRVVAPTQPGVYVVGGKKVVVK